MLFEENEIIELKSEITGDICKEVIAFANTKGGTIYIGVNNDGSVCGVADTDESILRLNNMVRDSVKPDLTMFVGYDIIDVDEKKVIVVTVQKGTGRPYYLASKGLKTSGVYVRNGTGADPATDTAIRNMIKETDGDIFEEMRSLEQELTFKSAEVQFEKCKVAFDASKMVTMGMMSVDKVYSNLALLLSDQCNTTIKAATFSGTEKGEFQDRREFEGSLFKQMEELYAYLDLRNKTKSTFDGLYRKDIRDYPEEALREALLNSIVHRDYSISASTLVSVYDDRIEFVSVGGLTNGITLDDIMLGLSVCRNTKLASIFYRLNLIEAYGTGIPKILRAYDGTGLTPKIETTPNAFKIILPNCNIYKGFTAEEQKILDYLKDNKYIVRSDVDELLGVSQATSSRLIKNLLEVGALVQEGNGKNTKYYAVN